MRNALLPLAAVLAISALAIALLTVNSTAQPGESGPALDPGPIRLTGKARYQVPSAPPRDPVTTVTGAVADPAATPWRVVIVAAGDAHPLTRTAVYALAEQLALAGGSDGKPPAHGVVPLVVPMDTLTTMFALPADRVLAISHVSGDAPAAPDAPVDCRLALVELVPRLPADHPGATAQAGAAWAERRWTIAHRDAGADGATWAGRYAGLGRRIASEIIATVGGDLPGRGAPIDGWTALDGPLVEPPQLKPKAYNTDALDLLLWRAAFQTPLVRGWVGVLPTATYRQADGATVETIDLLDQRLVDRTWKFGGWQRVAGAGGADRLWEKRLAGRLGPDAAEGAAAPEQAWTISARPHGAGWLVCAWQERPQAMAVFRAWEEAAAAGSASAARLVETHRGLPRLGR